MKTVLQALGVIAALGLCWVVPAQALTVGGTTRGSSATTPFDRDTRDTLASFVFAPERTHTILVSENNLSGSNSGWTGAVGGTQTDRATTVYALFADANNSLFGTGTSLCSPGASRAFAATCASGPFSGQSFSLTDPNNLTLPKAGFTSALAQAPEPGTLLLLGSAMVGLGALRRRRVRTED
jgi:hypothetical protein